MSPRGNGVGVVPHPMLLFFLFTLIANTTTTNGYEKEGSSMKKSGPSAKLEEWFGSAPQESAVLLEEGDPVLEEEERAMIGQTEEDDHVHEPTFFLYDSSQSFPKIAYHGGSKELSPQQLRSSEHQLGTNDEDEEDWEPSSESGRKHARSTRNDNNKESRTKKRKNLKKKMKKKNKKKKTKRIKKKTPAAVPDKASESEKERIEQQIEIFGRKNLPTEALLNPPTGYSYKVPDVDELDCEEGVVKAYVSFDSLYSTPSFTIDHRGGGSAADSRQSRDSTTASSSSSSSAPPSSSYSLPSRVYVPKQIWQTPPQFDDKMYRLSASHDFIIWADGEGRVSELYYQESNELTLRSHFNKTSSAQTKLLSLIVTSSPRYRVVGIDSEGRFLARCFRTESTIDCTALGNNLLAGSPTSTTSSSTKSTSNRRRRRSTSSRERRSSGSSSSSSSSSSPKAADSSGSSSSSSSNKRRRKRKKKSTAKVKNTKAARDYSSSSSSAHSTTSKSGSRRRRNKWRSTRDENEDGGGDGLGRSSDSDGDAVDDEEGADGNHHTATVEEGEEEGEGGEEKHGRKKQHSYFWLDLGSAMPSYSFKGVVVVSLDSQRFFLLTKTGHLVSMETDKRMASWKTWPPPPGDVSLEIIADAQVATPRGVFVISADGSLWQLQIDGNDDADDDDGDDGDGDGDDDDGDDSDEEDDNDNAWEMRQQTANRWICHYHPEETGPLALMEALAVQRGDSGSLFLVTRSGVLVEWRVKDANGGITKRKKQKKDSNNANKRTTKRRSTRQKKMKKKKMKRRRRKKKNKMTTPPHPTTATAQKHKVKARRASDSSSSGRWIVHGIPDASDKGTRLATSPVAYSNEGSFYLFMISEDGNMQEYQIGLYASGSSRSIGSNEDHDHTNESSPPSRWITHEATKVPLAHMRGAISRKSLWFFRQDGFIIESQIIREEGGGKRRRGQGGAHGSISSKRRVKSSASSSSPNGHSKGSKHLSPPPSSSGRDGLTTTATNSIVAVTSGQCTRIKSKWDCLVRNQEGEIVPSSPPSDAAATEVEIEES